MSTPNVVNSSSNPSETVKVNKSHRIMLMTNSVIDKLALQMTLSQLRLKHLLNIAMSPKEVLNMIPDEISESELLNGNTESVLA